MSDQIRASVSLQEQFGPIDIYLFDQLLRARITPGMRILDAGCGSGRNIIYFLRQRYEVYGVDTDASSIDHVRWIAASLAPTLSPQNFRVEPIETMSFPDSFFDVLLLNTVLHFARDDQHFAALLQGAWRVLRPGGLFFCRLASTIGMEHQHIAGRRFLSPDGAERYLVDELLLLQLTYDLNAELLDPLKTTVVQDQRSMTTWVLRKHP